MVQVAAVATFATVGAYAGPFSAAAHAGPKVAAKPDAGEPDAEPAKKSATWCAPELERLPGDVCFFDNPKERKRRTLVVFLHGWVQRGLGWQHAQQRAAVRGARRLGFSVITPRGRTGASKRGGPEMVSWPTSPQARKVHEDSVLQEWKAAQEIIEQRQGALFDEVFVVGFSNGAYYASSLAMRGRLAVDGYAVFAGGSAYAPQAPKDKRAPVFVGICSKDSTAKRARDLRRQLRKYRWPHRAETRKVGHTMADKHLDHALAYLRKQAHPKPR